MRTSAKTRVAFLIAFGIIFTVLLIFQIINPQVECYLKRLDYCNDIDLNDNTLRFSLRPSMIHVDDNWTETKAAGLCTGEGTFSDPYIIENLVIDVGGSGRGIFIENSDAFFIIQNCTVYDWGEIPDLHREIGGIELFNVRNARIINNTCSNNSRESGIYLYNSDHNNISRNIVENNYFGILIRQGGWNTINDNEANNNYFGINVGSTNLGGGTIISGNTLSNNEYGMNLGGFYGNSITGNIASNNNADGITLSSSHGNTILGNTIINNGERGLLLARSRYNNISENSIGNNQKGIFLDESDSNLIIGNNLAGNDLCWEEVDCENNVFEGNICDQIRNETARFVVILISSLSLLGLLTMTGIYIWKKKREGAN